MGGRPAKAISVCVGARTKDEIAKRERAERALRGDTDLLVAPDWFNERQREVFDFVVGELDASHILGNVDVMVLVQFSVAVERLEYIEQYINDHPDKMTDKGMMLAKSRYTDSFKMGMRELCLSPQARAKMGIMAAQDQQEQQDPLLTLLSRNASA